MLYSTVPFNLVTAARYDELLADGWFRGANEFYTSLIVRYAGDYYGTRHLRYHLPTWQPEKKHQKLIAKNARFRTVISVVHEIDAEREALFELHKHRFSGFTYESLNAALNPHADTQAFLLHEVAVYDGPLLVALSYFDIAENSAATLTCLFRPEYARYSPGIYTMLCEMQYVRELGLQFYYTGYVFEDHAAFDYKKKLGTPQWLTAEGVWQHDEMLCTTPARDFRTMLSYISFTLVTLSIDAEKKMNLLYQHADNGNYVPFAVYYQFTEYHQLIGLTYDLRKGCFVLFGMWPDADFEWYGPIPEEYRDNNLYEKRRMIMGHSVALATLQHLPIAEVLMPMLVEQELQNVLKRTDTF
ncbi:MAG: hypothetical protein ACKVOR_05310 [Flavobacteriales bacterium]